MRKLICVLLCAAMIFGAVPAWAADNTVKLTGEGIFIDSDTESTVWVDQKGGKVGGGTYGLLSTTDGKNI